MQILGFISAILAVVYLVRFSHESASWTKSAVKTGCVGLLGFAAFIAGGSMLLVIALVFSAIGDFFLSRGTEKTFMFGVAGFAAAHLMYIALFLGQTSSDLGVLVRWPRLAVLIGLVVLGITMARLLWAHAGDLRVPVIIYIPIILGMGISALTLPVEWPLLAAIIGAFVFISSDLILAFEQFVVTDQPARTRVLSYLVWATYWPAQALILWGFAA